jgi:hypothetical protein
VAAEPRLQDKESRQGKMRAIIKQSNKGYRHSNEGRRLLLNLYRKYAHYAQARKHEGEAES